MNSFWVARRRAMNRARTVARRYVPAGVRSFVRGAGRSSLRGIEIVLTGAAATILKVLPDGVSVGLRERLALERPLDYEPSVIALRVTSRVEKDVRLRSCEKEPETIDWIHQSLKAGDVLFDIGANVGAYSLVAARSTRGQATVYAFEPGSATFSSLVENIFINACEDAVIPFQVALGSRTALVGFEYGTLEAGGASHGGLGGPAANVRAPRTQLVPAYRLDDFVELMHLKSPTHLKIDVDGGELAVLEGAAAALKSPALEWVLVEVTVTEHGASAVRRLLEQEGFVLVGDYAHAGSSTHNWIFRRQPTPAARVMPSGT